MKRSELYVHLIAHQEMAKQCKCCSKHVPLPRDGKAIVKIVKVEIAGDEKRITDWLGNYLVTALGSDVEVM